MIKTSEEQIAECRRLRNSETTGRRQSNKCFDGEMENWRGFSAQTVGLVHKVTSVQEVIDDKVSGAKMICQRMEAVFK